MTKAVPPRSIGSPDLVVSSRSATVPVDDLYVGREAR
jgi:hypothetical protein